MRDFLDRLAARAIGSEAMLTPRLPSLFEPLQRAPIMPPLSGDADVQEHQRETTAPSAVSTAVTQAQSPRTSSIAGLDVPHAVPASIGRVVSALASDDAAGQLRSVVPPPTIAAAPPPAADDRFAAPPSATVPSQPEAVAPAPVQPRQTRIAPDQDESATQRHASTGALSPLPSPGMTASRVADTSDQSTNTRATRARITLPDRTRDVSSAPVVHVSIGRLEVRAAPAAAAPTRRREGPQPSSLDDYLRQRGGKAVP